MPIKRRRDAPDPALVTITKLLLLLIRILDHAVWRVCNNRLNGATLGRLQPFKAVALPKSGFANCRFLNVPCCSGSHMAIRQPIMSTATALKYSRCIKIEVAPNRRGRYSTKLACYHRLNFAERRF